MPITDFKVGINLTVTESLSWLRKISKLTSIRHRCTLLRVAHGEIYTKERLTRFRLANDPTCPRCDSTETLAHKILDCTYINKIWLEVYRAVRGQVDPTPSLKTILGAQLDSNLTTLTLKAEIIQRILYPKDNQTYLIHPRTFVKNAIEFLIGRETATETKEGLKDLLT